MRDASTKREIIHEVGASGDPADAPVSRYSVFATGFALLTAAICLFLVWQTVSSLLVIFAGILFAALLDAAARMLAPVLPVHRAWRLTLVVVLLGACLIFAVVWGAGKLPEQTRLLLKVLESQLEVVREHLSSFGVDLFGPEGGRNFSKWLFADESAFLSHAQTVVGGASNILGNILVVLFLGVLFAYDVAGHRESLVMLVKPSYRARTRAVLDEMGSVMRLWLVGQVLRVILMTVCVWIALYLIGLPGPFVLGLQAGFSNFIPYVGPIVAAVPIALAAMPLGGSVLFWSMVIYTIIQSIEGYVIGPLIQRQAVEIPPAWTLVAILLLGALFGVIGIALAMPLVAIGRVAIVRFYVEDCLGDRPVPAEGEKPTIA
ncbi:MAG: AI-2E family transporter [Alphaproteobacteria bacterium]|nr:AI-2E family transporter [Alphaproteobacteria bacterium]